MYDQLLEIIEVIKVKIHKKDQAISELQSQLSKPPLKAKSDAKQEGPKHY